MSEHANLRGAALLAGMTLGRLGLEEIRSLVPVETTHRPDQATRARLLEASAQST